VDAAVGLAQVRRWCGGQGGRDGIVLDELAQRALTPCMRACPSPHGAAGNMCMHVDHMQSTFTVTPSGVTAPFPLFAVCLTCFVTTSLHSLPPTPTPTNCYQGVMGSLPHRHMVLQANMAAAHYHPCAVSPHPPHPFRKTANPGCDGQRAPPSHGAASQHGSSQLPFSPLHPALPPHCVPPSPPHLTCCHAGCNGQSTPQAHGVAGQHGSSQLCACRGMQDTGGRHTTPLQATSTTKCQATGRGRSAAAAAAAAAWAADSSLYPCDKSTRWKQVNLCYCCCCC
jgi:hypothetical protein